MAKFHVLRNYSALPDSNLADFGLKIAGQMAGNGNFLTPAVTSTDLTVASNALHAAIAAQVSGGKTATIAKNTVRAALISLLDELALDVERVAMNNQEAMSSSGFDLAKVGGFPPSPVGGTSIVEITNPSPTTLDFEFAPAENMWAIELQSSIAGGAWTTLEFFTHPKDAQVTGLTSGTLYAFRARAHGSNNQRSAWSDPVSHMAT